MSDARIDSVNNWAHDIVHGVGGLKDYQRYELAIYPPCLVFPDEKHEHSPEMCEAIYWAVRCLTNPDNRNVLDLVIANADQRLAEKATP